MLVKRLHLHNFRNHASTLIDVAPQINMIVGNNGEGKTALLEALHLLVSGRSFRTSHLSELVRFGTEGFCVEVLFVKHQVEQKVKVIYDRAGRRVFHNETPLPSLKALIGMVQGVTLTPQDEQLISGPPRGRRQMLDLHLSQLSPLYLHHLTRFHGAMTQRNLLLKQGAHATVLAPYDELLQISSLYVSEVRAQTLQQLQMTSAALKEKVEIVFEPMPFVPLLSREREVGVTLTGSHKEDFSVRLEGKEARHFASEGQKRAAAMALKFALFDHLKTCSGMRPLLCIDDLGMSFDSHRLSALLEELGARGQVFVTSCSPLKGMAGTQLHVDAGTVRATLPL